MKRYVISFGLIALSAAYALYDRLGVSDVQSAAGPQEASLNIGTPNVVSAPTYSQAGVSSSSDSKKTPSASGSASDTPKPKPAAAGQYADGSYTGSAADAYYGNVQVRAVVSGGKLTAVQILQYPNDRSTSRYINSQALPYLEQEAIAAQSASVNTVSGASDTSQAFRESLASALVSAKN